MSRSLAIPMALLAFSALPAPAQAARDDPFESFNRRSFAFSMKLDHYIVGPLAKLSTGLTPTPVMRAIRNVIVNLSEPQVFANEMLQLRPARAAKTVARLAINTTVGLLGTIDVAARVGLRHHPNGFGDTLGHYGMKSGPYLYIPVLGPSDFRDLLGAGVDQVSSPLVWVKYPYRTPINLSLGIAGGLGQRAQAEPQLQALLSSAADPYATLRSTYLQAREAEIRGDTALPPLLDLEGPGEAAPPGPASPGPPQAAPLIPAPPPAPPAATAPPATAPDGSAAPAPSPPPSPAMP